MQRLTSLLLLVALCATAASAAPDPLCGKDLEFVTNVANLTLNLQGSFAALNSYAFQGPLFTDIDSTNNAANKVATFAGHCTILSVTFSPFSASNFCVGEITINRAANGLPIANSGVVGTLLVQGTLQDNGVTTSVDSILAIVGGTGIYRSASGELTIHTLPLTPGAATPYSQYLVSLDKRPSCGRRPSSRRMLGA